MEKIDLEQEVNAVDMDFTEQAARSAETGQISAIGLIRGFIPSFNIETEKTADFNPWACAVTSEVETPPAPVLSIAGTNAMSGGDISLIIGAAKSRKTTFAAELARLALMDGGGGGVSSVDGATVAYFDTEQSAYFAGVRWRQITGSDPAKAARVDYFALRKQTPAERLYTVVDVILSKRPTLAVIDGIADLVFDTNDNESAAAVIGLVMSLAEISGTHITSILHTTAANVSKGRGHLGSELERKCETVFKVEPLKDCPTASKVTPHLTRGRVFPCLIIENTEGAGVRLTIEAEKPKIEDLAALLAERTSGQPTSQKELKNLILKLSGTPWEYVTSEKQARGLVNELAAAGLCDVSTKGAAKLYTFTAETVD